jgi:hypothetical protein
MKIAGQLVRAWPTLAWFWLCTFMLEAGRSGTAVVSWLDRAHNTLGSGFERGTEIKHARWS